ncbi:myoneurin-like isoform X3 [Chiloscyllium plagiosum]|uniref:myoneurin-like isoform X3 n=1 Tax=Chiloscyllium plagiosum TaxID=36176 RepID=UPI001CB82250|nr:myoneurin-like isoform X3 [Chiloscyllium plagiosum]
MICSSELINTIGHRMQQVHHCKQLLDQLQQQRLDGFLCDCTVVIGQLQFRAHRNVLAAFSNYFRSVYGLSLDNNVVFLDHNHVSSDGFQKILDFIYTGNMNIDGCNVAAIEAAAGYLQMEDVVKICKVKMESPVINLNTVSKAASGIPGNIEPSSCFTTTGTEKDIVQEGSGTKVSCEEKLLNTPDFSLHLKSEELQMQPANANTVSGTRGQKPKADHNSVLPVRGISPNNMLKCTKMKRKSGCTVRRVERRIRSESTVQLDTAGSALQPNKDSQSALFNNYKNSLAENKIIQKTNRKQRRRCSQRQESVGERCKSKLITGGSGVRLVEPGNTDMKQLKMKPICNICGKVFSEASSLRRHMRIHKGLKPYVCQLCAKAFTQCNQLKTHIRTHTGEKPYQCDMCDKSFAQKCQLVFHNRMHHGEEKPYACDVCSLQFATSSNLKIHARKHSGEKPYVCDRCGQRFAQASTLTYHVRRHTGEKPYICDTCGKAFAVSSSLITHARKHTGEKPYSCRTCNKSFISSGELNKHSRSHTGEKPFVCELCGNSYSDVKNLKKHSSKAHDGINLQYNNLTNCAAEMIGKLLLESTTITDLNLMCNDIGSHGAKWLSKALQETQSLIALATVLHHNKTLRAIDVGRPIIHTIQEEATVHMAHMLQVNQTLQELHLVKMGMRNFGIQQICDKLVHNHSLRLLDLHCNQISSDGAKSLAELLKHNTPLKILDLAANRIEDDGLVCISDALRYRNNQLLALSVARNNISGIGLMALANALKSNNTLTNIYVWGNNFDESASIDFANLIKAGRLKPKRTDISPYWIDGRVYLSELAHGLQMYYYWTPLYGDRDEAACNANTYLLKEPNTSISQIDIEESIDTSSFEGDQPF